MLKSSETFKKSFRAPLSTMPHVPLPQPVHFLFFCPNGSCLHACPRPLICMHTLACLHRPTCQHTGLHVSTQVRMAATHSLAHLHSHLHLHTRSLTQVCMSAHRPACLHACPHVCLHTRNMYDVGECGFGCGMHL